MRWTLYPLGMGQSLDFLLFPPVNAAKLRHGRIAPGCAGEFLPCPSSGVQQVTPRKRRADGTEVAEHFFHDVSNPVGWFFGFSLALEAAIDKELEEVEYDGPQ